MRTPVAALLVLALIPGCYRNQEPEASTDAVPADSIVLERSRCFGFCPAYRLSLGADGVITFSSRNPRDTSRVATDTIPPRKVAWLAEEADSIGFFQLPPVIAEDPSFCQAMATDHPSATVTVFQADSATRVVDYLGCYPGGNPSTPVKLQQLRHFELQIDSVAQSDRWIERPGRQ